MIKNKKYLPNTNLILAQKKEIIKNFLSRCKEKHKIKNMPSKIFDKIFSLQRLIPETISEMQVDCYNEVVITILSVFRNKKKRLDFSIRTLLPLINKNTKKEIVTSFPQTIKKTDYYQVLYSYISTADRYEITELFQKQPPPLQYIKKIVLNTNSIDTIFNLYMALKKYPATTKNFNDLVSLVSKLASVLILDKKIKSINISKNKTTVYKRIVAISEYTMKNNTLPKQITRQSRRRDLWELKTVINRSTQNGINIESVLSIEYTLPLNLKKLLTECPLTISE